MSVYERYLETLSLVVVGSFNPAIFQPAWFVAEGLLPRLDEGSLDLQVVHGQFTSFRADWLTMNVDVDRFQVSTTDASAFDSLRDLVLGTLRLLRHTPVRALGVNTDTHFRLESADRWRSIQERYAPVASWREVFDDPDFRGLVVHGRRPDRYQGYLSLVIEPSVRVEPGAYIRLNDHFEIVEESQALPPGTDLALEVLSKSWGEARARSRRLPESVVQR